MKHTTDWINVNCRFAMPLPKARNYPPSANKGLDLVSDGLNDQQAVDIEQRHPDLGFMDAGAQGIAYEKHQGADTVIKVTTDGSEARAAQKLIDNPCSCVVGVYGLRDNGSTWEIEMERVIDLTADEAEIVDKAFYAMDLDAPLPSLNSLMIEAEIPRKAIKTVEKYLSLLRCLTARGFKWEDMHGWNVGKRKDGSFVAMDLGRMA